MRMRDWAVVGAVAAACLTCGAGTAAAGTVGLKRAAPQPAQSTTTSLADAPSSLRSAVKASLAREAGASLGQEGLVPTDGATGDRFGSSVAISGTTAVVGAPHRNGDIGAAYVFTQTGGTWTQQAELTASDGVAGDRFGDRVAISGSLIVVGARLRNSGTGAAYVFGLSGGAWVQQAELTASDGAAGDNFGWSVATDGAMVLVGATERASEGAGAAYVFTNTGGTWAQSAELTSSDGAPSDEFGSAVGISGSMAVVGARSHSSGAGAAYVFRLKNGKWSQRQELAASDAAAGDQFGGSVAIDGSLLVAGAAAHSAGAGAAYVFSRSNGTWSLQAELTSSDSGAQAFGSSVALSGTTLAVGAPSNSGGVAFVFQQTRTVWPEVAELSDPAGRAFGTAVALDGATVVVGAPNAAAGAADAFTLPYLQALLKHKPGGKELGAAVAISGSTAVVGQPGYDYRRGQVFVFSRSGGAWGLQAVLAPPIAVRNGAFGASVALSGSTLVIGGPGSPHRYHGYHGAAYVYSRSGSTWTYQAELSATEGQAGAAFGSAVAVSGSTIVVGAPNAYHHYQNTGRAYVFTGAGSTWTQAAILKGPGGISAFGWSVAIDGSIAAVGAPSGSSPGTVSVFVDSGGAWAVEARLTSDVSTAGDQFGYAVALSGTTLLVGAPGANQSGEVSHGGAYLYVQSGTSWLLQQALTTSAPTSDLGIAVAVSPAYAIVSSRPNGNLLPGGATIFARSGSTAIEEAQLPPPSSRFQVSQYGTLGISGNELIAGDPYSPPLAGAYVFILPS